VFGTIRKQLIFPQGERPWETSGLSWGRVIYDPAEHLFKMWYRSRCPGNAQPPSKKVDSTVESSEIVSRTVRDFFCYATSADGIQWDRPDLEMFDFNGRRHNNILSESMSEYSMAGFDNVIQDTAEPNPEHRYKGLTFCSAQRSLLTGNQPGMGICVGYSADGLRWTAPTLILSKTDFTDCDMVLPARDPDTGKWIGFFRPRTVPKRRFIGYSESTDFEHWTFPRMLLAPTPDDDEWTEFYGLAAGRVGAVRIGLLWVFHNHPEFSPVTQELVFSESGRDWHRVAPRTQFLPLGIVGERDSRSIYPTTILDHNDEHFIYFTGLNSDHGSDYGPREMGPAKTAPGQQPDSSINLARLPWGHWSGWRADQDGLIETDFVTNYGAAGISILAELGTGGQIQCEILDQFGRPIPGWDKEASRLVPVANGRYAIQWGAGLTGADSQESPAGGKVGHVVKLKFKLRQATLFGFQAGTA